jgi:UDP-glucose:(heptosyl)LPS alpha-1,3-glucosyltransferase
MIGESAAVPKPAPDLRRIVFLWQKYSEFGGAELLLDRTMAALAARGRKIAIISTDWPDRGDGIAVINRPVPRTSRAYRAHAFARAAREAFAGETGALVQANQPIPGCSVYRTAGGVHAAYLRQRGLAEGWLAKAGFAVSPFHRNALKLERETFAHPALRAVIANSAMVADEIVEFYGVARDRIHHIPNGVELDRFHPGLRAEFRRSVRAELGLDDRTPAVLFIGSGYRRKGLSEAIAAAAASRAKPHLWVIGRDSHPARFIAEAERAGIGDRFRIFGPRADPRPWFGAADAAILPSWYEPFGIVVLEALATGLPVVVSSTCGAREAVEQADPALVAPVGSRERLADALDRALAIAERPESAARMRAIAERYGMDVMIDRMLRLYEALDKPATSPAGATVPFKRP